MSKKRTLSSFGDVASNSNINSKDDIEIKNDLVSDIIKGNKTKDQTHVFKGYYLENKVANKIDNITAGKPRGTKSDLVNEIIKQYFIDHGIL